MVGRLFTAKKRSIGLQWWRKKKKPLRMHVQSGRLKACFPFSITPWKGSQRSFVCFFFFLSGAIGFREAFSRREKCSVQFSSSSRENEVSLSTPELLTAKSSLPIRVAATKFYRRPYREEYFRTPLLAKSHPAERTVPASLQDVDRAPLNASDSLCSVGGDWSLVRKYSSLPDGPD